MRCWRRASAPSTHEIARRLVYPHMRIGRGDEWKASSERRRTQRLIDEALRAHERRLPRPAAGQSRRCDKKRRRQNSRSPAPSKLRDCPPGRPRRPATGLRRRGVPLCTRSAASTGPRYLRTPDAAKLLGLSPRTLEKHRCYGTGPVFRRLGGRVVYALDDLEAWADLGTPPLDFGSRASAPSIPPSAGRAED